MNLWLPKPSPIRYVLAVLPLLFIGVAIWLWGNLSARVALGGFDTGLYLLGLALMLTLVLAGLLGYMAWCAFSMRYTIDRQQLRLRCGFVTHVVPLASVVDVRGPGDLFQNKVVEVRWKGVAGVVPGYVVGEGVSPQLGRVMSVATQPAPGQVFVVTPGATFGLSPRNSLAFMKQLNDRRDPDIADDVEGKAHTEMSRIGAWGMSLWSDRVARGLFLAGLALNSLLFVYLSFVYADLPVRLALHWNAQAQVDRIGDPIELLSLPVFALGVWLANALLGWWVLKRERAATLFLLAGGVAAQVVFMAGVLSIVVRAI
jgi:hypothetical protein